MKYPKEYLDEIKLRLKVSAVVSKAGSLLKQLLSKWWNTQKNILMKLN